MPIVQREDYNYPPIMLLGQNEPPGSPEHLGSAAPYAGSLNDVLLNPPEAMEVPEVNP